MEHRGYGWRTMSDEDRRALDYQLEQVDQHDMRIGMYERDYTIEGMLMRGSYEIGEEHMLVSDVVWGSEYIGNQPHDQLLIELARTPLFRRLQAIEQLTLGKDYATMPNSMYFSRWEHIWGSLVFVRKMIAEDTRFDDRQKMVLQLRTLLSDVGHTAFSHLGDWMFQGPNGGEDMHDQELRDVLQVSGVASILEDHGFNLNETVFPEVEDWVECSSPELCVDRVDYGMREILRWGTPTIPMNYYLRQLHSPKEAFEIDDGGRLLMKDPHMARLFAAGFSILPTEHWTHPIHRLQLQLFQSGVRSAIIDKIAFDDIHPREALYGIDDDFMMHLQTWPMKNLKDVMKRLAVDQRQIFVEARRADLNHVFMNIQDDDWAFPAFPDPLEAYTRRSEKMDKPYPANIVLQTVATIDDEALQWDEKGLVINLPPLKARAINPPISTQVTDDTGRVQTEVRLLSELEPSYATYLEGQRTAMAKSYKATVLMRPDIAKIVVAEHQSADVLWAEYLNRPRNAQNLAHIIRLVASSAAARSIDKILEVDDNWLAYRRRLGEQGILFSIR